MKLKQRKNKNYLKKINYNICPTLLVCLPNSSNKRNVVCELASLVRATRGRKMIERVTATRSARVKNLIGTWLHLSSIGENRG